MANTKKATKAEPKAEPKKVLTHTCFPRSNKDDCEACVAEIK